MDEEKVIKFSRDRRTKAGGVLVVKEMTLREALCTKVSTKAVPSMMFSHLVRKAKEYRALERL